MVLTEAALRPRNSLRASVFDKHLTCSRALPIAWWILGMQFVTIALSYYLLTKPPVLHAARGE